MVSAKSRPISVLAAIDRASRGRARAVVGFLLLRGFLLQAHKASPAPIEGRRHNAVP
jgi:hypothetical protein